jgi:hypothetical protein
MVFRWSHIAEWLELLRLHVQHLGTLLLLRPRRRSGNAGIIIWVPSGYWLVMVNSG